MRRVAERARAHPVLALTILSLVVLAALLDESGTFRRVPAHTPRERRDPREVIVATYNVNFGLAGDEDTLAAIRDTRADVVVLEETNDAWADAIEGALEDAYPHRVFRAPDRVPAGGLGVISRWPLEVLEESHTDGGFFVAWRLRVRTPEGPLQLLAVHLRPQVTDDGSFVRGRFQTGPNRAREMRRHLATLEDGVPTLVLGDFNEEAGEALELVHARGLRDAGTEHAPRVPTWRWPLGPLTLRQTFDHILFTHAHLACTDAYVIERGRSDHLPVIAHLAFVGAAPQRITTTRPVPRMPTTR